MIFTNCDGCKHSIRVTETETVSEKAIKLAHQLGRNIGIEGDTIKRRGNGMVLSWYMDKCLKTNQYCIPDKIMHNCHFFENKPTVTVNDDEWYMD